MSIANVAVLGSQAAVGLVGLAVGGAKVTDRRGQVEAFQRYGYPPWFRRVTGVVEIGSGIGLIAGLLWRPELALVGGVLFAGVMAGAVLTHVRVGDSPSKTAIPGAVFVLTVASLAYRYLPPI